MSADAIAFDLVPLLLACLLAFRQLRVPLGIDCLVLTSDLRVDAGDLFVGIRVGEQSLDPGPHLLEEPGEMVPALLQEADEAGPGIDSTVDRFQPRDLDAGPGVRHEAGDAEHGALPDARRRNL